MKDGGGGSAHGCASGCDICVCYVFACVCVFAKDSECDCIGMATTTLRIRTLLTSSAWACMSCLYHRLWYLCAFYPSTTLGLMRAAWSVRENDGKLTLQTAKMRKKSFIETSMSPVTLLWPVASTIMGLFVYLVKDQLIFEMVCFHTQSKQISQIFVYSQSPLSLDFIYCSLCPHHWWHRLIKVKSLCDRSL